MDTSKKPKGTLRTGFTTGTCATASSKAAILSMVNQKSIDKVDVLLPKRDKINIQIKNCKFSKNTATCSVIKDGGDDPDVTHGAEIIVELTLTDNIGIIEIDGGVTLENANKILESGANVLVAGSTVFKSEKPLETIYKLKNT